MTTFSSALRALGKRTQCFSAVPITFLFLVNPFLAVLISAQDQAAEIETIRQRILTYEVSRRTTSADAIRALYNRSVSNSDLNAMARAYANPDHDLYQDTELEAAFHDRLADYCRRDPAASNSNWWFRQVPDPHYIARACLLMGDALTESDYNAAKKIINRGGLINENPPYKADTWHAGPVGVNTIWEFGPQIDNGIIKYRLFNDTLLIRFADNYIKTAATIDASGDQLLSDWSYPYHSYISWMRYGGGYGSDHSSELSYWVMILHGTSYALSQKAVDDLSHLILDYQQWVSWKDRWDWCITGREVTRGSQGPLGNTSFNTDGAFLAVCDIMAEVDPARSTEFKAYKATITGTTPPGAAVTGNRYFWDAGQVVHRRMGWYAAPAVGGGRCTPNEVGLGENLRGKYFGAGVCQIFRTGNEYDGLSRNGNFNWQKLPGIISPEKSIPSGQTASVETVSGAGTGGVSDGWYGMAAMNHNYESLSAKRSWFFFDDEFVVLACAVNYGGGERVTSTLNQCLLESDAAAYVNEARRQLSGDASPINDVDWVYNNTIAYLPVGDYTGSWKATNSNDIFTLWIDHGARPSNGNYCYAVVPGIANEDIPAYRSDMPFRIVLNTPTIQSVTNEQLRVTGITFYEAGQLEIHDSLSVDVNLPCFVLIREQNNTLRMAVSNIPNANQTLQATIHTPEHTWQVPFDLPGVPYAGKSVVKTLDLGDGTITGVASGAGKAVRSENIIVEGGSTLSFYQTVSGMCVVDLYDCKGNRKTIYSGVNPAGSQILSLPKRGLAPGVYYVKISTVDKTMGATVFVQD